MRVVTKFRLVVALALVVGAGLGMAAFTLTGDGQVKSWAGVQVTDPTCTTLITPGYEDMAGMSLPFETKKDGRVVVMFQGQFGAFTSTPNARAIVRLTIDDEVAGTAVAVGNDHGTGLQTFGYNAFSQPLDKGSHTLKAVWHTFNAPPGDPAGPATSCVEERSLILLGE